MPTPTSFRPARNVTAGRATRMAGTANDWRCMGCGKLLGVRRDGVMHLSDLPPGRPSFITRVLWVDSFRFWVRQARRARRHQVAQAPGALLRGSCCPAMNAA